MTDADALEYWNERAAIREHDGETKRQRAEYLAAKDIQRLLGVVPDCVADAVARGKE